MKKFGMVKKLLLFFLLLIFISGIAFCLNPQITRDTFVETLRDETPLERVSEPNPTCHDLLIRLGNELHMFNTRLPHSNTNPIVFQNLDEYLQWAEIQRREHGSNCPVLYLQEEHNTQGEIVYRARPSPTQLDPGNPVQVMDSSDDNKPYNIGHYQGFDAHGQQIGEYTQLDSIHDSTSRSNNISDNPMDPNWGGVLFSQSAVKSGKYIGNQVGKQPMVPKVIEIYK
jgi:hypothetical protein